jgi:hypothetical protein
MAESTREEDVNQYAKGTAWVNGDAVPNSTAVFPGDLVQTKPDSMADIREFGRIITLEPGGQKRRRTNKIPEASRTSFWFPD